jgi:ubiquinol-cytochrome c reductase cytochrome c1 subunit
VVSAVRSGTLATLAALAFAALGAVGAQAAGPAARMEQFSADPHDVASLQRGARLFVNYCLNCHSAKYMRYNRLSGIGLTDAQIADNLIFAGSVQPGPSGSQYVPTKIGDTMQVAMRTADGKAWFGAPPPDLSVEARVRGGQWLYNYLIGFYRDERSTTGWNNLVFPNVAMPHVLWELSGTQRAVATEFKTRGEAEGAAIAAKSLALVEALPDHRYVLRTLAPETPGSMSPVEYRQAAADLVNFMQYVAEPSKNTRQRLGLVVLMFLGVLFVFAYWLKREYWKDLH